MSFQRDIIVLYFCNSLIVSNSVSVWTGEGAVKQKVDRYGQGEGRGLKTSRSLQTSFMGDPFLCHSKLSINAQL